MKVRLPFGRLSLEQGVIYRTDRREVLVDSGGLDPEPPSDLGQCEPVDPVLGHHLGRDVEDLLDGFLPASGPPVEPGPAGLRVRGSFQVSLESFRIERPSLLFVKIDDACRIDLDLLLREEKR